eukprot:XP_014031936.1 PREDICTED: lactadherin-like [Salmo salar]
MKRHGFLCPLTFICTCVLIAAICSVKGDYCEVNLCHNGGTCVTGVGEDPFICICADAFTGDTCHLNETGPCIPNPCRNDGSCEVITPTRRGDVFSEYVCKCQPGFEGVHCQISKFLTCDCTCPVLS